MFGFEVEVEVDLGDRCRLGWEAEATAATDNVGDVAVVGDADAVDVVKKSRRLLVSAEVADGLGGGADGLSAAAGDGCAALGHDRSDEALDFGIGEGWVGGADGVDSEIDAVDAAVEDGEGEGLGGLLGLGRHWAVPFLC